MATIRDIKRRIKSVQNTKQITKAMEMVAAAKLRRAQQRAVEARPYAQGMIKVLSSFASSEAALSHPLFEARDVKRKALIVVTADRGLCGAYNSTILRTAEAWLREQTVPVRFLAVGRKALEFQTRRRRDIAFHLTDLPALADFGSAEKIAQHAMEMFLSGDVDQVELIFTRFITTLNRKVVVEKFLPFSGESARVEGQASRDYILEPGPDQIFEQLLPRYANTRLFVSLAEAYASEHGARMIAMGSANKNAGELIDELVLTRNRLRQAAITKELAEIVGGAAALA